MKNSSRKCAACVTAVAVLYTPTVRKVPDAVVAVVGIIQKCRFSNQGINVINICEPQQRTQLIPTPVKPPIVSKPSVVEPKRELTVSQRLLYKAGKYQVTPDHRSIFKNIPFNDIQKQGETIYITGSADGLNNGFSMPLSSSHKCGDESFENIGYYKFEGDKPSERASNYTINSNFSNLNLSLLRARSVQCHLKVAYPNLKTRILEGRMSASIDTDSRNVTLHYHLPKYSFLNPPDPN
jgi:hypothetical protein